jgi:hypothetical protein
LVWFGLVWAGVVWFGLDLVFGLLRVGFWFGLVWFPDFSNINEQISHAGSTDYCLSQQQQQQKQQQQQQQLQQ